MAAVMASVGLDKEAAPSPLRIRGLWPAFPGEILLDDIYLYKK